MILKQQLTKCLNPLITLYNHNITTISNISISQNKMLQILTNSAVCLEQMGTIIQNQCNFIDGIRNVNAGIGFTQKKYQYEQKQKQNSQQKNIKKKIYKTNINNEIKTNEDSKINIIPQIPQIFHLTQTLLNSIYRWISTNSINTQTNYTNIAHHNNNKHHNNYNYNNNHNSNHNNSYNQSNHFNNISLPPAKCSNCHSIMQTIRVKQIKQQLMAIPGISTRLYLNSLKVNNSQQEDNDNNFLNKQFWNSISTLDYQRQKHTLYAKADPYLTHWLAQQKLKQNKYYQVKAQIQENLDNCGKIDDLMIDQLIETMIGMFKKQLGRKQIMWRMKKFANKLKQLQIHRQIQQQHDQKQKQKLRLKLIQKQKQDKNQQNKTDECKCKCHHNKQNNGKQKDPVKPMTRFSVNTAAKLLVSSIIKVQTPAQREHLSKLQQNNPLNHENALQSLIEHSKYNMSNLINQQSSQSDHSSENNDKVQENLKKRKAKRQHSKSEIGQSLKKLHKNTNNSNKKFNKRTSVVKNLPIHTFTTSNKTKKDNQNQNIQKQKDSRSIKQLKQTCQFGVQCQIKIQQETLIKKTKNKIQRISKISNNFNVGQLNSNNDQKIMGWEEKKLIQQCKQYNSSQTITNSQNSIPYYKKTYQNSEIQNQNSQNSTKIILKSDNFEKNTETQSINQSHNKNHYLQTQIKLAKQKNRKSQHSQSLTNFNTLKSNNQNKQNTKYKRNRISLLQKSKSSTSFHTNIVPLPTLENNRDSQKNIIFNEQINMNLNDKNKIMITQTNKNEQLQKISINKYKKIRKLNNETKISNQSNNECMNKQYRGRAVKTELNQINYNINRQSLDNHYELDNKIQQILENRKKHAKVKTQNNQTNKKEQIIISAFSKTSNKRIHQKIFTVEDLELFGGLSQSSKFNADYHIRSIKTLNKNAIQSIQIGTQKIIKHIKYLKEFKSNIYYSTISFLFHPYQCIESGNLINTNSNEEELRKIIKAILIIHLSKCKQQICPHVLKFLQKILYMGDNVKRQQNQNFDKIKKKVCISK